MRKPCFVLLTPLAGLLTLSCAVHPAVPRAAARAPLGYEQAPATSPRANTESAKPSLVADATATPPAQAGPRNVILLLSDGTSPEAFALSRWVKGRSLNVDEILTGAVRTYGADSIITDSAPGATAYATGYKGTDKAISVGAFRTTIEGVKSDASLAYVPLPTVLEAARLKGYATGLIATSNIQHATPAAFSAHVPERNWYDEIAKQQVYQGIDVVLSGGTQHLLPRKVPGGVREDGQDLTAVLRQLGYQWVTTRSELTQVGPGKLWGSFASNDLAYELDRERFAPEQPSLAEMTEVAIRQLSSSPKGQSTGFFLFIEGSKVDWSAHANDPVGVVSDLLAFDDAVGKALNFAKPRADTMVVVLADHATGGLSIGTRSDPSYSTTDDDTVAVPLRRAKMTSERLGQVLLNGAAAQAPGVTLAKEWGLAQLSPSELAPITDKLKRKQSPQAELSRLISERARIGWTTSGHTGVDIFLFAYGPEHPRGLVENTAIAETISKYLELSLSQLRPRLSVDLIEALAASGIKATLDVTDSRKPALVAKRGARVGRLPCSTNLLLIDQETVPLEGLVVLAPHLGRVFGPKQAVEELERRLR